jgi:uncharacterized protein
LIAIDTNVLVAAHRHDSPWHANALEALRGVAEGGRSWSLPWPCLHEFVAVVTNPRIFKSPTPTALAVDQVEAWLESPTVQLLSEGPGYLPILRRLLLEGQILGGRAHDARIAGLCLYHGVRELWTADRDFSRFPDLPTRNPLLVGLA